MFPLRSTLPGITLENYRRLGRAGILGEDNRVALLDGQHAVGVRMTRVVLAAAFDDICFPPQSSVLSLHLGILPHAVLIGNEPIDGLIGLLSGWNLDDYRAVCCVQHF